MIHVREPAAMSPAERLAEIAEILVRGSTRMRALRNGPGQERPDAAQTPTEESNCLADVADHEPSCDDAVSSREKKEVA